MKIKTIQAMFAVASFGAALFCAKATAAAAPDLSGKTDDSIRQVLLLVSNRQIQKLADGDYTPVSTLEAFKAARAPQGLSRVRRECRHSPLP